MPDFLLELRSEEIPARMQAKARDDLARLFTEQLSAAGLAATVIETHATPRRLALIARGLPDATQAVAEEIKGPRADAPLAALAGFLSKVGLTRDQLVERPDARGNTILFARLERPGRPTAEILASAVPAVMRAFPWPKSMRWGAASASTESPRWVRPLQGIVALLGEEIVPFEVAGVHGASLDDAQPLKSGAATLGHRFHHPGVITIGGAHDYAEKLRACHVILDANERAQIIEHGAKAAAAAAGLALVPDPGLVAENAGLTEWPVTLLGRFDPAFLDVPPEVIQLTMRTNQKYFACTGADGTLAPAFICTANIEASDGGGAIVAGNERVLSARLADAKFFWEADLKVPLEEQAKKLGDIVFHEKLGTVADKVERVAKLARWLVEEGIVRETPLPAGEGGAHASAWEGEGDSRSPLPIHPHPSAASQLPPSPDGRGTLATLAERAARLCKADLVTQMVAEFPELQGTIGAHLARAQNEDPQVCDAIRDHYKPVGQGDEVPTDPVTVAVSLADKLDSLLLFPSAGMMPSGSSDPYAIRRAAIAMIRLMIANDIRLLLRVLLRYWYDLLAEMRVVSSDGCEYTGAFRRYSDIIEDDFLHSVESYHSKGLPVIGWEELTLAFIDESDVEYGKAYEIGGAYYYVDYNPPSIVLKSVWSLLTDRLKVQQREAGVRHDLIDAVFALGGEDDLVRLLARVRALQAFVETAEGRDLLAGYKRAANILKKEGYAPLPTGEGGAQAPAWEGEGDRSLIEGAHPHPPAAAQLPPSPGGRGTQIPLSYTPEPVESSLIAALDSAEPRARQAVEAEDFEGAMAALATLRGPVDAFFDNVTVNDPDPAKREERLALLARMRDAVHAVADFSKIEG